MNVIEAHLDTSSSIILIILSRRLLSKSRGVKWKMSFSESSLNIWNFLHGPENKIFRQFYLFLCCIWIKMWGFAVKIRPQLKGFENQPQTQQISTDIKQISHLKLQYLCLRDSLKSMSQFCFTVKLHNDKLLTRALNFQQITVLNSCGKSSLIRL